MAMKPKVKAVLCSHTTAYGRGPEWETLGKRERILDNGPWPPSPSPASFPSLDFLTCSLMEGELTPQKLPTLRLG